MVGSFIFTVLSITLNWIGGGGCRFTPSLPLLPGPLWLGVVVFVRVLSIGQIDNVYNDLIQWLLKNCRCNYVWGVYLFKIIVNNILIAYKLLVLNKKIYIYIYIYFEQIICFTVFCRCYLKLLSTKSSPPSFEASLSFLLKGPLALSAAYLILGFPVLRFGVQPATYQADLCSCGSFMPDSCWILLHSKLVK